MKVSEILQILQEDGWYLATTRSSHRQLKHPSKQGRATVAGKPSYGAYVPDLPGCIAVGETRREVMKAIREGIALRIEAMIEAGQPIPAPASK